MAIATLTRETLLAPADVSGLQQAMIDLAAAELRAKSALEDVIARSGPTVPLGEVVFVPRLPARVRPPAEPDPLSDPSGTAVLASLAGGELVVQTSVRPEDLGLVRDGVEAEILDEATSTSYPAVVASVAPELTLAPSGQPGHAAIVKPSTALPDQLVGANLRVTITAASTDSEVLVVPLAAVSSATDGTTRVSVVAEANDPAPVEVGVDAGLSAGGFVAVKPTRPGTLEPGDLVVVGT